MCYGKVGHLKINGGQTKHKRIKSRRKTKKAITASLIKSSESEDNFLEESQDLNYSSENNTRKILENIVYVHNAPRLKYNL